MDTFNYYYHRSTQTSQQTSCINTRERVLSIITATQIVEPTIKADNALYALSISSPICIPQWMDVITIHISFYISSAILKAYPLNIFFPFLSSSLSCIPFSFRFRMHGKGWTEFHILSFLKWQQSFFKSKFPRIPFPHCKWEKVEFQRKVGRERRKLLWPLTFNISRR